MATDLAVWYEVVRWLDHEAELLDTGEFEAWLDLLAEDVTYRMPVRLTRERGAVSEVYQGAPHFMENIGSLRMRVARLQTEFAWAEDPPSRTRRFVTNVRPKKSADGVDVRSYLLVYRSRGEDVSPEIISGERRDALRRTPDGLRLCRREIQVDQATLGVRNLALLL